MGVFTATVLLWLNKPNVPPPQGGGGAGGAHDVWLGGATKAGPSASALPALRTAVWPGKYVPKKRKGSKNGDPKNR